MDSGLWFDSRTGDFLQVDAPTADIGVEDGAAIDFATVDDFAVDTTLDAATPDTVTLDTVTPDTVTPDTVTPDTVTPDTAMPDTVAPDTAMPDTAIPDTAMPDTAMPDTAMPDTAMPDTAMPDTAMPDTAMPDTAMPDTAMPDSGSPGNCGAIVTFADGKQPISVVHVAPAASGGSDSSGDGSAANPFATIERAVQQAQPGTAIRLHSGTYSGGEYVEDLAGTANAPIWIGGEPGGVRPVIDGGGEALHLSRVRYLVIHDLEVRNTTNNGINCDDGGEYADPDATRYLIFDRLSIHDVGGSGNQDCLKLSGLDDFVVMNSAFDTCGGGTSGSGIDHVGCHDGLIARNTFANMSGNAVQCKGGSTDIEVRWNLMLDSGQRGVNMGGSTGFTFFRPPLSSTSANAEARRISVIANVIKGGITPFAFVGCVDCIAANNTIVDPENWLLRILQETTTGGGYTFLPVSNGEVINNLFYFSRSAISTYVNIGPDTEPSSFTFANNLWYAHDNPAQSTPTLPVSETDGVSGLDPGFADPAGDYTIGPQSPAAGQGKPLSSVVGDMDGNCYADPPSIGAYEGQPN
jgi:hypothetical protein